MDFTRAHRQRAGSPRRDVDLPDLVKRVTDLEFLSTLPPTGEKGGLASSYDHASPWRLDYIKLVPVP